MFRHCIVPPYMLRAILQNGTSDQQALAWSTLTDSEQFRGERRSIASVVRTSVSPGARNRRVYDARNKYNLPGKLVRSEGNPRSKDMLVNEAYDGAGVTYNMFKRIFSRNSIDNHGMRIDSTVHYGVDYENAFWNGRQMVYGDGDGAIFRPFTKALDVIAHELTHGITQNEANLNYRGQSGALNESFSDVFGCLVKQYKKRESAEKSNWLIGEGLFMPGVKAKGIRSMKEPGTAYDDPVLGKDPQPGHMRDYVITDEDNGGVHLNSGIPNRAFYELAIRLKGYAWEKAGQIWYRALTEQLRSGSTFRDAMMKTVAIAGQLYGINSLEQKAVRGAWSEVGI
jgi:Zn-dependent metalloprotease